MADYRYFFTLFHTGKSQLKTISIVDKNFFPFVKVIEQNSIKIPLWLPFVSAYCQRGWWISRKWCKKYANLRGLWQVRPNIYCVWWSIDRVCMMSIRQRWMYWLLLSVSKWNGGEGEVISWYFAWNMKKNYWKYEKYSTFLYFL